MTRLPLLALLVACAVLLMGASSSQGAGLQLAQAPADSGVEELWEEFPLEEGRPVPDADDRSPSDADGTVTPQAGQGAAPQNTPASAPQATPDPAPAAQPPGEDRSSSSAIWIAPLVVVLIAVGVITFLRVRRGRRRQRENAYPVWGQRSNVYAEGSTGRDGIGSFRGFVYAMNSGSDPEADRMLCIHDPSRDEPIWVRRSEVAVLSSGETARPVEVVADATPQPRERATSASGS